MNDKRASSAPQTTSSGDRLSSGPPSETFMTAPTTGANPNALKAALQREQAARNRLDALVKISSAVNSSRDLNGIFEVIAAEVRHLVPFDRASLAFLNEDRTRVQVYALSSDDPASLQVGNNNPAEGTVTQWVVDRGEPVISNDLQAESRFVSHPNMLAQGFRSSVSYPLIVREQKLGTLNFTSRQANCYSEADLDIIRLVADPIAIAVDNLRLLSLAEMRLREAQAVAAREETINRIVSAMRRTLDTESILHTTAEQLGRHTKADRCLVYTLEDTDRSGSVRASCFALDPAFSGAATWPTIREAITSNLIQGRHLSFPDTSADSAPAAINSLHRIFEIGSVVYVPVISQDKLTAVIELNQNTAREWSESDVTLVKAVADHLAVSLYQSQLHHEVIRHSAENAHLVNELRETNQKLAKVNKLKDEFLANLSHELRTPLTAITAWAELLDTLYARDLGLRTPELSEGLNTILNSSTALTQIIEDLIDLSRIQNDKLDLDLIPTDIHAPIKEALQMIRQQAKNKQIQLELRQDPHLPAMPVDSQRIRQVIWNLLSNSLKFTPPNGKIIVTTQLRDNQVEILVQDSGIGIEPSFLPYVFDRFRQEEGTKKRRFQGLGIGLTITKALIEAHHGQISVSSAGRNQGTTFTLTLPLPVKTLHTLPAATESTKGTVDTPSSQKEILVVEDDPLVLRLVGRMVEHLGYTPHLAESGHLALQLLEQWTPALILTDINMPEMDGFEFLTMLRKSPHTAHTPVVALTAFVTNTDRAHMEKAMFDGILAKPVRQYQLAEMIQKQLTVECGGSPPL